MEFRFTAATRKVSSIFWEFPIHVSDQVSLIVQKDLTFWKEQLILHNGLHVLGSHTIYFSPLNDP